MASACPFTTTPALAPHLPGTNRERTLGYRTILVFILGNYRLTVFVHASGRYQLITGERGWAHLNHGGKNRGWNRTIVQVAPVDDPTPTRSVTHVLVDGPGEPKFCTKRKFGVGHAIYEHRLPESLIVTKILSVRPSGELHQGNPSVLLTVTLENRGEVALSVRYREQLLACYRMMNDQDFGPTDQRMAYTNQLSTRPESGLALADVSCHPAQLLVLPGTPDDVFTHDVAPPLLFIKSETSLREGGRVTTLRGDTGDVLCAEADATVSPGEIRTLRFVVGLSFETKN